VEDHTARGCAPPLVLFGAPGSGRRSSLSPSVLLEGPGPAAAVLRYCLPPPPSLTVMPA
jgi:hypothetical protein